MNILKSYTTRATIIMVNILKGYTTRTTITMVNVLKGYTTMVQHISSNDGVNNTCSIVLLIGFIL